MTHSGPFKFKYWAAVLAATFWVGSASLFHLRAEDWPEWRGKGRRGVWAEDGILQRFPEGGLKFKWKAPVRGGYSGPAVSNGRVYLTDYRQKAGTTTMEGIERLLCLDESSGEVLWAHEWEVSYSRLMASYAYGPRATPTVDLDGESERVYVVGATGLLRCLDARSGELLWEKDFAQDYGTRVPTWGVTSAPLIDGPRLIAIVGGRPDAEVVAFDKRSGAEVWRALSPGNEMGYGQPVLIEAGGVRQLIVWHPQALSSLDPETGRPFWEQPYQAPMGLTVATPVRSGPFLFVSQFYGGSLMMKLESGRPAAELLWQRKGSSEMADKTDSLHALISTPVIEQGHIYGVCSYGQLRCLLAGNGDRLWESLEMIELSRWAAAFIVRQGDRYFINNDRGELIIARFDPQGYHEVDRTSLIEPTSYTAWGSRPGHPKANDRIVNWSHPAYANRHIFARNDKELICASLEAKSEASTQSHQD